MFIYAQQCEREWYEKYLELSERHKELWKEYNELRHNAIFENIFEDDDCDNTNVDERNERHCQICHSTKNVHYYATDGYIKNKDSRTFLSGGFYMCDNCLNACKQCEGEK